MESIATLKGHIFDQQIKHARQMLSIRLENNELKRKLEIFTQVLDQLGLNPDQIEGELTAEQITTVSTTTAAAVKCFTRVLLPPPQISYTHIQTENRPTASTEDLLVSLKKRRRTDIHETIKLTK